MVLNFDNNFFQSQAIYKIFPLLKRRQNIQQTMYENFRLVLNTCCKCRPLSNNENKIENWLTFGSVIAKIQHYPFWDTAYIGLSDRM